MNKIEVSREVFEKIFRKGGEMKYKEMTNQFMQELPEHVKDIANAEIEKNEYLQTKGTVKKALGETHENGGIKTVLEEGDRVLSDFLKIGAELSKKLNKEYEIKTKATDTYAKVLDKYLKKIGHTEATEELEGAIKKLDTQKDKVKDEATLALNQDYLMNEIKEYGDELDSMEDIKTQMFTILYNAQEESKDKNKPKDKFQDGGFYSNYNPLFTKNPGYEGKLREWLGSQFQKAEYELGDIQNTAIRFKELADNAGVPTTEADFKDMNSLNNLAGRIQKQTIEKRPALAKHYGTLIYPTRAGLQQLVDKKIINPKDYGINLINGKVPRGSFDTLSEEQQATIQTKIQSLPQKDKDEYALTNYNDNLAYFRGIMSKEQYLPKAEFEKFLQENKGKEVGDGYYSTNIEGAYVKPYSDIPASVKETAEKTLPDSALEIPQAEQKLQTKRPVSSILFPDKPYMMPDFQAPMKFQPKIYSGERVEISPEQALMERERSQMAIQQQLDQLPDAQRASTLASLDANNAANTSKIISETSRYNAQAKERESYEEAQARTRQSLADQQAGAQYQQLMGRELESYRNDLQNMYNSMYEEQKSKWEAINQYNRSNALNPSIVFDGQSYYVAPEALAQTQRRLEELKPKGKKGGRFSKKRFV